MGVALVRRWTSAHVKDTNRTGTARTPFRRQNGLPCLESLLLEGRVCARLNKYCHPPSLRISKGTQHMERNPAAASWLRQSSARAGAHQRISSGRGLPLGPRPCAEVQLAPGGHSTGARTKSRTPPGRSGSAPAGRRLPAVSAIRQVCSICFGCLAGGPAAFAFGLTNRTASRISLVRKINRNLHTNRSGGYFFSRGLSRKRRRREG